MFEHIRYANAQFPVINLHHSHGTQRRRRRRRRLNNSNDDRSLSNRISFRYSFFSLALLLIALFFHLHFVAHCAYYTNFSCKTKLNKCTFLLGNQKWKMTVTHRLKNCVCSLFSLYSRIITVHVKCWACVRARRTGERDRARGWMWCVLLLYVCDFIEKCTSARACSTLSKSDFLLTLLSYHSTFYDVPTENCCFFYAYALHHAALQWT